jgi:hypothetical protein
VKYLGSVSFENLSICPDITHNVAAAAATERRRSTHTVAAHPTTPAWWYATCLRRAIDSGGEYRQHDQCIREAV